MPEPGAKTAMAIAAAAVAGATALNGLGLHPLIGGTAGLGLAAAATLAVWRQAGRRRGPQAPQPARSPEPFRLDGLAASLLADLPLGLILLDGEGRVLLANAMADEMLERSIVGLMGPSVMRAPALSEAIAAALADGHRSSVDASLLRSGARVIHASVGPLGDGARQTGVPRIAVLLEDRTRSARAEELRRDFVANASHELRTPLASISGFIETLQAHGRDDPAAAERFLAIMATQAERMRRLIDDLLSLNRIEINEHVRPRDLIDAADSVREIVAALGPVAREAGVEINVDLADYPFMVRGSHSELAQVFANLIDNAVKYGRDGGCVWVSFAKGVPPRPGMKGIAIADDGPGIAREHLPRLTERFYRVSAETSRRRGGTGLGLAIAKHIMNRHRGELAIASTPGKGSCFTVWLPEAAGHREAGEAA